MPTFQKATHVLAEELDGEVLAIDERTGVYFSMTGSAVTLWNRLIEGVAEQAIIEQVIAAYPDAEPEIGGQVSGFVQQLCEAELLVQGAAGSAANGASSDGIPVPDATGWKAPVLGIHDEMQEILLFDPIHQVDYEQGWPHKGSEAAS